MKITFSMLSAAAAMVLATPALAGAGVPLPVAGVFGPVGIAAAAVVYGGYRAIKFYRTRR